VEKIKENLAKTRISVQDIDGCDFQLYAKEHPNILANLAGREVKHGSYGEGEIEKIIPHDDGRIHVVVRFFENGIKTLGSFIYLHSFLLKRILRILSNGKKNKKERVEEKLKKKN